MNNLTLIVDCNWLLMSRLFSFEKQFNINNPAHIIEQAQEDFIETLSRSIVKQLNSIPSIDGIVLVSDGGSWRKQVPVPNQISDVVYKGHRTRKTELDWQSIYGAFRQFIKNAQANRITTSTHSAVEGDDWVWYWSRKLNAEGISTIIWSSDCDLKQLVQVDGNAFTAWFNENVGLVLPECCKPSDDPMEYFMNPPFQSAVLENLKRFTKKIHYINPDLIVVNKVLCGDAGDNIKSCARYTKNNKTYKFTDKDYNELQTALNVDSISKLIDNHGDISKYICATKKFSAYNILESLVDEMIQFNIRMVWINEETLPETVLNAMCSFEYSQYDIRELKSNYRILCNRNNSIEDIFNEAVANSSFLNEEGLPF